MRREEQELLEIKQGLLVTQQDLQGQLIKEIDRKRVAIDKLKSEIQTLENRCKEMAQAAGIPLYK
jgi:hypothetical protein